MGRLLVNNVKVVTNIAYVPFCLLKYDKINKHTLCCSRIVFQQPQWRPNENEGNCGLWNNYCSV